jgi:hypothetical protein
MFLSIHYLYNKTKKKRKEMKKWETSGRQKEKREKVPSFTSGGFQIHTERRFS